MIRLFAWLFLFFPLGVQPLYGQAIDRQSKMTVLLKSEVLSASDIARADSTQPFLIDRWHFLATTGWSVQIYPEGKGEPTYPTLDLALWQRYTPFDLELLGYIHRLPTSFSRYRIGTTRKVLTLFPAQEMTRKLNDIRFLNSSLSTGQ